MSTTKWRDLITLLVLVLVGIGVWSMPFLDNVVPFGEGDAAYHYGRAYYMLTEDHAPAQNPYYYYVWYGLMHPDEPWRPIEGPLFFVSSALMGIFGQSLFLGLNLATVLLCSSLALVSVFFVVRQWYGFHPALLASFLMIFSLRDALSYLWGQRLILASFAAVPLTIYFFGRYVDSYLSGESKPVYFYMVAVLLVFSSLMHMQGAFIAVLALAIYVVFMTIKARRVPIGLKTTAIAVAIYVVLFAPFAQDLLSQDQAQPGSFGIQNLDTLFTWYTHTSGTATFTHQFGAMHGGYWTVFFVVVGLLFLIYRRNPQDLLVVAWFVAIYLALHIDVIGLYAARKDRFLKGVAHLLYPLVAIGVFTITDSIASYAKQSVKVRETARYVVTALMILAVLSWNAPAVYSALGDAYPGYNRLTVEQLGLANWLRENTDPEATFLHLPARDLHDSNLRGWLYQKMRWKHMLSTRAMSDGIPVADSPLFKPYSHVIVDYSDFAATRYGPGIQVLSEWAQKLNESTVVYRQNNIEVYEIDPEFFG